MGKSLGIQILEHLTLCASSMLINSLFLPRGVSFRKALRDAERIAEKCPHDFSLHSRGSISTTLSRLKSRGLLTLNGSKKKAVWYITKEGRHHFKFIDGKDELLVEDGKIRLVTFDIPENLRNQRRWLRTRLLACDYEPLQKSVWMGTRALPEVLFEELTERQLIPYVHVVGLDGGLH